MAEDMRGLFYIVRGNYKRDKAPKFWNEVSESYHHIGGYDPEDQTNEEWYMLFDNVTFMCNGAGSDMTKLLDSIYRLITTYKTRERYLTTMRSLDVAHSPIMIRMEQEVFKHYGDYFSAQVRGVEDKAYEFLATNTPVARARKKLRKRSSTPVEMETPKTTETPVETVLTPKRKKGLKPTKRQTTIEFE